MLKVVLIFDQGLAGAGGKSNPNLGLEIKKGGIGSYTMLEPHLKKINANILATLYCGNEYFLSNQDDVVKKMSAMVKKLSPDVVVCGPCFNFPDYAKMSAMITKKIIEKTDINAVTMMSSDNKDIIEKYRAIIPIIKMPKKGGVGLSESLENLSIWMDKKYRNDESIKELEKEICF